MTGGPHIRAIGADSDAERAQAPGAEGESPLNLEEEWAEEWDDAPARRSWAWLVPAAALAAVAGWTAFFVWAGRAQMLAPASPQQWSAWIVQWSATVMLVLALWLLAMRNSRREAARFADAAQALSRESRELESRLTVVNRELSLAREFLAAQSRELESLGRVASGRLSEHAERLQGLIVNNGAQVQAIAGVSAAAVENMDRLRDGLPVIANSARDV
ncbi:MAG: ATPase, partial [Tsuneonella sp.]